MIVAKHTWQLLALRRTLHAVRVFPMGWRFTIPGTRRDLPIPTDEVAALVAARVLMPPTGVITPFLDAYDYEIYPESRRWVDAVATEGYRDGIGVCPRCTRFPIAVSDEGRVRRHGFTASTRACAGSGMIAVEWIARPGASE